MDKGIETVVKQGMTRIQKLRKYSRNAQFHKHLDEVTATIKLLEGAIETRNELIDSQHGYIDALERTQHTLEEILQQDYPEVWKALHPPEN